METSVDISDHFPEPPGDLRSYAARLLDPATLEREPMEVLRLLRPLQAELAAYERQLVRECMSREPRPSYAELAEALKPDPEAEPMSRQAARQYVLKLQGEREETE
jgi:hypothetical protein